MPTSTVEDYLKAILLEQQRDRAALVTTGRVAAAVGVAPGTATAMVKALADGGLVSYEPYSGVALTGAGRQLAIHVLRRHRLIEQFLVEVLKMDWSEVHQEADLLEHAVTERVLERIDQLLGYPSVDPHGDPIPDAQGVVDEPELASLLSAPVGVAVRVVRVDDQSAEFLQLVERRGLMPGSRATVEIRDEAADAVDLRLADGGRLSLGMRAASKILVQPAEAEAAGVGQGERG
jgi:DtxR family Mn-dependent transcriptional regulator